MQKKWQVKYVVEPVIQAVIFKFLNGELSSREAAKEIGLTHQGVINLTTALCRQWFQEGKLTLANLTNK